MSSAGDGAPGTLEDDDVAEVLRCSRKGCGAPAVWALRWNNPRLHTPDRRKVWLAC
ncbi:MAG: hypothetical protein JWP95_1263, partial [Actinotalea sp.]|nr:hypothetical protein [Actinotalea sp.]